MTYLIKLLRRMVKMAEREDKELTFSHGHSQTIAKYRTPVAENGLKTSRTGLLQLRI